MRFVLVLAACSATAADRGSFDCIGRNLALEFAVANNPGLTAFQQQEIADALEGSTSQCNVTVPPAAHPESRFRAFAIAPAASTFYIDFSSGSDTAAGTQAAPFKTVARGLTASRSAGGGGTLVLRAGTHFVSTTCESLNPPSYLCAAE